MCCSSDAGWFCSGAARVCWARTHTSPYGVTSSSARIPIRSVCFNLLSVQLLLAAARAGQSPEPKPPLRLPILFPQRHGLARCRPSLLEPVPALCCEPHLRRWREPALRPDASPLGPGIPPHVLRSASARTRLPAHPPQQCLLMIVLPRPGSCCVARRARVSTACERSPCKARTAAQPESPSEPVRAVIRPVVGAF